MLRALVTLRIQIKSHWLLQVLTLLPYFLKSTRKWQQIKQVGLFKQKYKQHVETPMPSAPGISSRKPAKREAEGFHVQWMLFLFTSQKRYIKMQFLTTSFNWLLTLTKTNYCIYSVKCHFLLLQTFVTTHTKILNFIYHMKIDWENLYF